MLNAAALNGDAADEEGEPNSVLTNPTAPVSGKQMHDDLETSAVPAKLVEPPRDQMELRWRTEGPAAGFVRY